MVSASWPFPSKQLTSSERARGAFRCPVAPYARCGRWRRVPHPRITPSDLTSYGRHARSVPLVAGLDPEGEVMKDSNLVSLESDLTVLADELLELESETFSISDYADASEAILASCSSSATTSTTSSTTSTTSCSA
jgi:thiazolylpeptide-type bacteriocin precursor